MKGVVIGGSGLIGKKLVPILRKLGHEAVPASPSSGVNTLTGERLAPARWSPTRRPATSARRWTTAA